MSVDSDNQSTPTNDAEPHSKWESFKEKVEDTVSSMRENARDEVSIHVAHQHFEANSPYRMPVSSLPDFPDGLAASGLILCFTDASWTCTQPR